MSLLAVKLSKCGAMREECVFSIGGCLLGVILASGSALAQPSLNLKTRQIDTRTSTPLTEIQSPLGRNREHLLLQLNQAPSAETIGQLRLRGVNVLQDVPENGLLVSVGHRVDLRGLGVVYAAPIAPADKISPLITAPGFSLVEFHPDADMNQMRGLLLDSGVELHENPDLNPYHLMIRTDDPGQFAMISVIDEVGYIFPASPELTSGLPTAACMGALDDQRHNFPIHPNLRGWLGRTGIGVRGGCLFLQPDDRSIAGCRRSG